MCCATPSVNSWEGMHDRAKWLPRRLQLERELFHGWFSTQTLYPGAWVWGYLYTRRKVNALQEEVLLLLFFTWDYSTPTNWMFAVTKHFTLKIIGCQHLSEYEHMSTIGMVKVAWDLYNWLLLATYAGRLGTLLWALLHTNCIKGSLIPISTKECTSFTILQVYGSN